MQVEIIKNAVRDIRNLRADMNVPPSKKASVYVVSEKEEVRKVFEDSRVSLCQHLWLCKSKYMYRQIKLVLQTMQYLPLSLTPCNLYAICKELVDCK